MVADTEHSYRGTNFAVITLIVLLVLVGGYLLVAQISDVADDPSSTAKHYNGVQSPAAGAY